MTLEQYNNPLPLIEAAIKLKGAKDVIVARSTYADQVVNDVINGTNGKVWRGTFSSLARYAALVLPAGIQVSFHTSIRGSRSVLISF